LTVNPDVKTLDPNRRMDPILTRRFIFNHHITIIIDYQLSELLSEVPSSATLRLERDSYQYTSWLVFQSSLDRF
jgi:hypothetical protein